MREEERSLLQAIANAYLSGRKAAVATVVGVVGSAYRREGTKMLIDANGQQVCMISGGCLEQEVGDLAQQVIALQQGTVKFFDLNEDVVWGLGLGCGGAVNVYIEPLDTREPFKIWLEQVQTQQSCALVTLLGINQQTPAGLAPRMLITKDMTLGNLEHAELEQEVYKLAQEKMSQLYPRSETRRFVLGKQTLEVFIDVHVPPAELAIFGAGHDAIPLASYAHQLGFKVTVIDARQAFVTPERFPNAFLLRTHPSGFADKVTLSPRSYVVIMNHHLERDKKSLAFALNAPVPYIGVLGPRQRYERMLATLKEEGVSPSAQALSLVRNPIGVDIGADTPEEIAVSIMSELIAIRNHYKAGFLHDRYGDVGSNKGGKIHAHLESV